MTKETPMTNGEKKLGVVEKFVIGVSSLIRHSSFELRHFY